MFREIIPVDLCKGLKRSFFAIFIKDSRSFMVVINSKRSFKIHLVNSVLPSCVFEDQLPFSIVN